MGSHKRVMKYVYYYISCFLMVLCTASVRAQDLACKGVLLMVHFGTTHDDTRTRTLDAISDRARQTFSGWTVREAYASSRVRQRLAKRGISKPTATDALLQLRSEGFRSVTVQPTFVIDGKEMALLRREIDRLRPFFDTISVSNPLLYSVADCERVCQVLAARHPANVAKGEHVVFVGHGTVGPATALYSQLDYMLRAGGRHNYHVATLEGYPTQATLIQALKAQRARRVVLVPLLFVAGDHASNDINVEWKEALEQQGFSVSVVLEGLGEVPQIQELYLNKVKLTVHSDLRKSSKMKQSESSSNLQVPQLEKDEKSGKLYMNDHGAKYEVIQDRAIVKLKRSCQLPEDIKVIRNNSLGFITIQVPQNTTLEDYVSELRKSGLFESIDYATYGGW